MLVDRRCADSGAELLRQSALAAKSSICGSARRKIYAPSFLRDLGFGMRMRGPETIQLKRA